MIVAVDFDDTLCDSKNVPQGYRMGQPVEGAVAAIRKLVADGHTIIIFTARSVQEAGPKKAVADWLDYFNIPYSGITNIKSPHFDAYIDDRAIHFSDWPNALSDLDRLGERQHLRDTPEAVTPLTDITKPLWKAL